MDDGSWFKSLCDQLPESSAVPESVRPFSVGPNVQSLVSGTTPQMEQQGLRTVEGLRLSEEVKVVFDCEVEVVDKKVFRGKL